MNTEIMLRTTIDSTTLYVTIIVNDAVIISTKDFDEQRIIMNESVFCDHFTDTSEFCFYDLVDGAAYYQAYADKFPERKEVVDLIDSLFKALSIELY